MNDMSSMHLAEGRTLAFAEAGDPGGYPVMLAHGFPGSRLEARVVDQAAVAARVRLICLDRPGFGGSDPQPGRRLVDWPADVAGLADHLGIGAFAVVGFSGGGPYALACAALLGDRVSTCATVSSPGPLDRPGSTAGMALVNKLLFGAGRRAPMVTSLAVRLMARLAQGDPAVVARRMGQGMAPSDQRLLADPAIGPSYGASIREAFAQGRAGPDSDAAALGRPWSFSAADIACPTHIWHGIDDRTVPLRMAHQLRAAIPGSVLHGMDGSGHLLFLERASSILGAVRDIAAS